MKKDLLSVELTVTSLAADCPILLIFRTVKPIPVKGITL
nr:MAG TPA: hypothetical protein [Caudoviricetes sp.]